MFISPLTGQTHYTAVLRCIIKSVGQNTLTVRLLDNFSSNEVGDPFDIAKPFELQRDNFDNMTIDNVLYTYQSEQHRTAERQSDLLTESHIIIPPYIPDSSVIFIMSVSNGAGSNNDLSGVIWVDLNISGRAWGVGEPPEPPGGGEE